MAGAWHSVSHGDAQREWPRQRSRVQALRAEFLPPAAVYLSTDSLVSVLYNERPLVLDPFGLALLVRAGTPAGRDLEDRVRRQAFGAIVMRENGGLPSSDMNAGDSGFDDFRRQFWVNEDDALARVFRLAYEIRAVRWPRSQSSPHVCDFSNIGREKLSRCA